MFGFSKMVLFFSQKWKLFLTLRLNNRLLTK
jgi:hypothetical protein